ncbi:hypothetical protein ACXZ1K_18150 [Pedobacter sp. PWIIR3]
MKLSLIKFILAFLLLFFSIKSRGQAGISASPPKLYYRVASGAIGMQKVIVTNPISRDLEVAVSLGDWDYDSTGTNQLHEPGTLKTSCADWVRILPGSFFTVIPDERKELSIELAVPENADKTIPVRTAMLYFTQTNPESSKGANGASIKISVRMGIKIYHSFTTADEREIDVKDFRDIKDAKNPGSPGFLEIDVENTGKIWIDGEVKWEMINSKNGEKVKMDDTSYLALPGDKRVLLKELPKDLKKGNYAVTAVINYGNKDELKVLELDFEY